MMARNTPPAGNEIAEQALRLRFEDSKTVDATRAKDDVHVRFTPTRFEEPKKREELEAGIVLGRVQLEVGQYQGIYKAKLRSGKYHLFLAKVGEAWKGYAEFNGGIALEAKTVKVEEGSSPGRYQGDAYGRIWQHLLRVLHRCHRPRSDSNPAI